MHDRAKTTVKKPEAKKSKTPQARKGDFNSPIGSPVDQIFFLQRTIGNQAVQKLFKSGVIQAKLRIGQPGDIYDQEADRVAEQIMRMPEAQVQRQREEEEELVQPKPLSEQIIPVIQRQIEPGEEEEIGEGKAKPSIKGPIKSPEVGPFVELPFAVVTKKPTRHPIIGGPEKLLPEKICENGRWELWDVIWEHSQKWVCDERLLEFLSCIKGHYECTYKYTAIWKCSRSGEVKTTFITKTVKQPCYVFG